MTLIEIYKQIAILFDLSVSEPANASNYLQDALVVITNASDEPNLKILLFPFIYTALVWKKKVIWTDVHINEVAIKMNEYIIRSGYNLTDFVNSINWDNGVPSNWIIICDRSGFNTTGWI